MCIRTGVREKHSPPVTPDGRYFVVRGRLWRCSNPALTAKEREHLVHELMLARSAKGRAMRAGDAPAREAARRRVDAAKHALGERGAVWWEDGAPDLNRHMAKNTLYAEWFASLPVE
jgi:hypothetical protein